MAGRGPQSFKKRQKEQQRKERQQEKLAKRLQRKSEPKAPEDDLGEPLDGPVNQSGDLDLDLDPAHDSLNV